MNPALRRNAEPAFRVVAPSGHRSLSTLARNRGAGRWDPEGFTGHRSGSRTEIHAIGELPTAQRALATVIDAPERLAPRAPRRTGTGATSPLTQPARPIGASCRSGGRRAISRTFGVVCSRR